MAISVICPGCKKRFQVSDQFAGKQGPCPSCKTVIKIPEKNVEVKIIEPEKFGPKGASGRATLQPIFREETKFNPVLMGVVGAVTLVVLVLALLVRFQFDAQPPLALLALGAILLAPPLVYGGYFFLRDPELAPYRGTTLWLRVAACAAVYALMWGVFWWIKWQLFDSGPVELYHLAWILPLLAAGGTLAAFASFDLEWVIAALHFGFYLLVTIVLRLIMMGAQL